MIINGKEIAEKLKQEIKEKIEKENLQACLAVVLVGDNPSSKVYIKNKKIACEKVGIKSISHILPESTTQTELNLLLKNLSNDESVSGILLQLPLPKHLDAREAIGYIVPEKDVDGLTSHNLGKLTSGGMGIIPCTPLGIIKLIKSVLGENLEGKNAVVVGRSILVGKPTALALINENATVTLCHSKTKNLKEHTLNADILVVAVGKPKFIDASFVKKGATVIDVGITKTENGLVGDVDFESVSQVANYITPVPGGVGPMTIACLLENTYTCAKNLKK